ncbi:MAG TPA: tRNA (N6-threonylcarbamoyladenosine(37)-N6)-methyltransferase TrmO [Thermoleophilia bacterium]|nr:tRNA (N6-threonylcarbamoyladenosine(37)-N6)-methyltransferase TrmO [Thermoleophilia bacterium]
MTSLVLDPIGIIHSEHTDPRQTPIQPSFAQRSPGRVEVFPPFAQALDDLDGFSHLHLIYWLHRAADVAASMAGSSPLKVVPFLDDVPRGVFATRAPVRPNPLGMSVVRLVERRGSDLLVEDLDVLDGTPLLDIKPYVARFDVRLETRSGWMDEVSDETARRRGERRPDQR